MVLDGTIIELIKIIIPIPIEIMTKPDISEKELLPP